MDYRKLIKFGENSYVISLPTKWIKENKLKKGDIVNIELDNDHINLYPCTPKKEEQKISEVIIDYDKLKTAKHLKIHLTAAYINGYDQITLSGTGLLKESNKIREVIKDFIGLETIEQTPNKVVLREFVDVKEVSFQDVIRRIDRIILSMIEDTENHLKGKNDYIAILKQKDADIFKLYNFIFRAIKYSLKQGHKNTAKLTNEEILYYWEFANFQEKIANQIKRIPRYASLRTHPKFLATYQKVIEFYKDTMKANYTKNTQLAIELIVKRKEIFEECEEISQYVSKSGQPMIEKMKNATDQIAHLSKILLKHSYN